MLSCLWQMIYQHRRREKQCFLKIIYCLFQFASLFKACVRYFLPNFYFSPNDSPSKIIKKCFLFHLKNSFHSWDIQIFVYWSSHLLFHGCHCFRGWLKKKIQICDVITCLNEDLITHFVWYLEKDIRCDIETLSIDRVLNTEHFYVKIMQKMCTKS